jgi:hypothetical protein
MTVTTERLQKELHGLRLHYLQWFLSDIAHLSDVIAKEMGEKKYRDLLFKTRCRLAKNWTSDMAKQRQEQGKENTIKDLIEIFWEPLREQGYKFSYIGNEDGSYDIKVTNCIVANVVKELGIERWMKVYLCRIWECEAIGFNPKIGLTMSKTIMQGDDFCSHHYYWKKS